MSYRLKEKGFESRGTSPWHALCQRERLARGNVAREPTFCIHLKKRELSIDTIRMVFKIIRDIGGQK